MSLEWDEFAVRQTRERMDREIREKALAEGLSQGRAEGLSQGRAEGLSQGRAEGRAEMATAMKVKGFSLQDIADISGLSIEEIQKL